MNKHLELLGFNTRDVVTGFEGVVVSITFDLFGCVQAFVLPKAKAQKIEDGRWFDAKRLQPLGKKPVMPVPTFENVPGGLQLPPPEAGR